MELASMVVIGVFIFFLYRAIEEAREKRHQQLLSLLDKQLAALELASISTISGSILSAELLDLKTRSEIEKAKAKLVDVTFSEFSAKEGDEDYLTEEQRKEAKDYLEKFIKSLSISSPDRREHYLELSQSIYEHIKRISGKDNA